MMKKFLEFFEEENGQLSNARLANFMVTVGFVSDWITHIARGLEFDPSWTIVSLVTAVMGIKMVQKKFEQGKGTA